VGEGRFGCIALQEFGGFRQIFHGKPGFVQGEGQQRFGLGLEAGLPEIVFQLYLMEREWLERVASGRLFFFATAGEEQKEEKEKVGGSVHLTAILMLMEVRRQV